MQPVTNAELDQFYGSEVSQGEVDAAIARHVRAFDEDDLVEVVNNYASQLLAILKYSEATSIAGSLKELMCQLIADRVSIELFGRHGCVKAEEVKL